MNHIAVDDPDTGIYRMIPLPDDLEEALRAAHSLTTSYNIPGAYSDQGFVKTFMVLYALDGGIKATSVEAWDRAEAYEVLARVAERGVITIPPSEQIPS
jgi:hypothetical protein